MLFVFILVVCKTKKTDLDDRSVTVSDDKIGLNSFRLGSDKAESCEIKIMRIFVVKLPKW